MTLRSGKVSVIGVCVLASWLVAPPEARAQTEFMLRGFADVGSTTFAASQSFDAVLGSDRGLVFGGGVEAVFPWRVFASLRGSRFRDTGERLFVFNGQRFALGIPTTVTVTPVQLTGGYRVDYGWRLVPYVGVGVGWHRYREISDFAEAAENVDERFTGYHILGGAEFRIARWVGTGAEVQWATVPDALGQDPNSVSKEFGEDNLGGVTVRVKIVVGR
ncbi:MAG: hypothetical protein HY657_16250 [Acidobacteria bacterium]|nr:hypothetical protein [Acidobacteriota bacterium]